VVADPHGRKGTADGGDSGRQRTTTGGGSRNLPDPDPKARPPRSSTSAAWFTLLDVETVGYDCFLAVMASDRDEIRDLRAQHGLGADAVDGLDRSFYELKVYRGDEPDSLRLEESQIRRAMATPNFFLVIVSNVEGANARPKVRVIVDPLKQLPMSTANSITLSGIRSAEYSQIYDLVPPTNRLTPRPAIPSSNRLPAVARSLLSVPRGQPRPTLARPALGAAAERVGGE